VTNSIEQRAAEIREMAEDGPGQQAGPTYGTSKEGYDKDGYSKEGYSKDGKQTVAQSEPPLQTKRWDVWAVGTGLFGHYDSSFNNQRYSAGQFTIGLDYRVTPHWLVGIIGDYTYASGTWNGQDFNANTFRGGLYTSFWYGGWYGTVAGLVGTTAYNTAGTTNGVDWTAYAGTGYAWRFGQFEIGPWASIEYNNAQGFAPLNEVATRLGGRVAYRAGRWTPYLQLAWQHNFWDTWTGIDRNALWGSVGTAYRVTDSFWVFADYGGQVGGNYWVQQVDLGAGFSW
jgi:uncharacterized protein with beta-barrel porin domain